MSKEANSSTGSFDSKAVERACRSSVLLIVPINVCIVSVFVIYLSLYNVESPNQSDSEAQNMQVTEKNYEHIRWYEVMSVVACFIFFIAFASFTLYFLYKHRCYNVIFYYLCTSVFFLLVFIFILNLRKLFHALNISVDLLTIAWLAYNNGILGLASVFNAQQMPKHLNQVYLIYVSSMVALQILILFPGFVCWWALVAVSVWDLFAVLTKKGPLNLLLKLLQERNLPLMPGMIYSAWMTMVKDEPERLAKDSDSRESPASMGTASQEQTSKETSTKEIASKEISVNQSNSQESGDNDRETVGFHNLTEEDILKLDDIDLMAKGSGAQQTTKSMDQTPLNECRRSAEDLNPTENAVKLGLGDFVFFATMVGKSSQTLNYFIILSITLTMSIGLILTLCLLILYRKPMPALPMSLFLGIFVYSVSFNFMAHFQNALNSSAIIL